MHLGAIENEGDGFCPWEGWCDSPIGVGLCHVLLSFLCECCVKEEGGDDRRPVSLILSPRT